MTPLMKKAVRGNRDALTSLYHSNKQNVLHLCNLLLCDPKAADQACIHVFKNSFEYVLGKNLATEQEFSDYILKKTVNHCKNKLLKKKNKTFKIPKNKNFAVTHYSPDTIATDGNVYEQILASLPVLHRYIYVIHYYLKWSNEKIADLIHTNADTVQAALLAEQINVTKIADCMGKRNDDIVSVKEEEFHSFLQIEITTPTVSRAIDTIVILAIDSIAAPIEEKAKKKMKKTVLFSILSLCLSIGLVAVIASLTNSDVQPDNNDEKIVDNNTNEITWLTEVENPTHYAIIDIADYGKITVALDGNSAPETVENFVTLAEEGFYDGLTFHRIVEGFMMQGGDPDADGTGGHKDENGNEINITGEFYENGYDNYLSHVRGAISMARGDDYDSASSQFFIVHEDSTDSLDTYYAAFGYVIVGMDVVDAVCEAAEPTDGNGTIELEEQPVITTITIYTPEEYEQLLADSTPDIEGIVVYDAKIAEVTAINDGVLTLTIYGLTESGKEYEITDLKTVDFANYEATEDTKEYTIDSTAVIYTVVDGALMEIEISDIVVGDMLVIDDGSDEVINIFVYHAEEDSDNGDGTVTE